MPTIRAAVDDATKVAEIDEVRHLIATGQWARAKAALDALPAADGPAGDRRRALGLLYRGVLYAEGGPGRKRTALATFREAIREMAHASAADRFRAHNNFANFLLGRAEDHLANQAFETATGAAQPFLKALAAWREAEEQYRAALALAKDLGRDQEAVARANLARLYFYLADLIRSLDAPTPSGRRFVAGEKAADARARDLAAQASKLSGTAKPLIRGFIEELHAQLAFRASEIPAALRHAEAARAIYREAGNLAGVESIERLLGLCHRRLSQTSTAAAERGRARQEALRHFLLAEELTETLRRRLPAGRIGRARAGFFARRAYVYEMLVELLLAEGKETEALRYVERSKARALRDFLTAHRSPAADFPKPEHDLAALLRRWPKGVAALEYFVGNERVWVFLVGAGGTVKAWTANDARGKPIDPYEFVARVRRFLLAIDHQARKMTQRLNNGLGFDPAWQDTLHDFYQMLVPAAAHLELLKARTVLIAPHHILHYFPFAALVTRPDRTKRGPLEMVQPRFLIDAPFALCHVPSLADWDLLRQRKHRPLKQASALAVPDLPGAPPLPGVKQDVQNLQAAFRQPPAIIRMDRQATEQAAWALLAQPGLVLFATHGADVSNHPLESRIFLYPDSTNHGRLSAYSIYEKSVTAELIALCACYSGLAERNPLPGDDLFGLDRAFLHSGARTVVSSLWDVYDGTAPQLTRGLFNGLAAGKETPHALADAQRAFLKKLRSSKEPEPWLHPYFWAVYAVHGDDRTGGK